jgi:hypothetical protein
MTIELLKSAGEQFAPLSEAERRMLTAGNGERAVCSDSFDPLDELNNPQFGANWDQSRTIRASVIHWLCAQAATLGRSPNSPIDVYAAKISGVLDLSGAAIPCPLSVARHVHAVGKAFNVASSWMKSG